MEKTVLIIDDEQLQATNLRIKLSELLPDYRFESYSTVEEIQYAIENRFYTLAIIDIRMDKLGINGIGIAKQVFDINPIASVIIMSAYKEEYFNQLKPILTTGKLLDVVSKQEKTVSTALLMKPVIDKYYNNLDKDPSIVRASLLQNYSEAKNESDPYKKGIQFERFIGLLFGFLGYKEIRKRVIDTSRNEVDIIIRNEIEDSFLNKFGKYILIECKNKPDYNVGKNDFIVFNEKLKNSNGLAELGIIATTGGFAKTSYLEAMRGSGSGNKVLFLSNLEFLRLIEADNKIEEFKKIIDEQVKNN